MKVKIKSEVAQSCLTLSDSMELASFNFMASVTVCSDFGTPKIKSVTAFTFSPSFYHEVVGSGVILIFLNVEL